MFLHSEIHVCEIDLRRSSGPKGVIGDIDCQFVAFPGSAKRFCAYFI